MTILRDATAINDGTTAIMAVSLRNHGDNGGATAVYAVQAPQWYRASGVTGVLWARVRVLGSDNHNRFPISNPNLNHNSNRNLTQTPNLTPNSS